MTLAWCIRWSRTIASQQGDLIVENINPNGLCGFRFRQRLRDLQTDFQYFELFESDDLGKTLRLANCLMISEKNEFFDHESLIHSAVMAHAAPEHALILSGGDGGALEERLKHPLKSVTLVEFDQRSLTFHLNICKAFITARLIIPEQRFTWPMALHLLSKPNNVLIGLIWI